MKRLVLPLSGAILVALLAALFLECRLPFASNLLLNLAAGLVLVLLTALYVDYVLRLRERQRQADVEQRVRTRLKTLASACMTACRTVAGYGWEVFRLEELFSRDPDRQFREVLRVSKAVVGPSLEAKVQKASRAELVNLWTLLTSITESVDKILSAFSTRLEPRWFAGVLDTQDAADVSLGVYRTTPEFLLEGAPFAELRVQARRALAAFLGRMLAAAHDLADTVLEAEEREAGGKDAG